MDLLAAAAPVVLPAAVGAIMFCLWLAAGAEMLRPRLALARGPTSVEIPA